MGERGYVFVLMLILCERGYVFVLMLILGERRYVFVLMLIMGERGYVFVLMLTLGEREYVFVLMLILGERGYVFVSQERIVWAQVYIDVQLLFLACIVVYNGVLMKMILQNCFKQIEVNFKSWHVPYL